jgi:hypothetical protein
MAIANQHLLRFPKRFRPGIALIRKLPFSELTVPHRSFNRHQIILETIYNFD